MRLWLYNIIICARSRDIALINTICVWFGLCALSKIIKISAFGYIKSIIYSYYYLVGQLISIKRRNAVNQSIA